MPFVLALCLLALAYQFPAVAWVLVAALLGHLLTRR